MIRRHDRWSRSRRSCAGTRRMRVIFPGAGRPPAPGRCWSASHAAADAGGAGAARLRGVAGTVAHPARAGRGRTSGRGAAMGPAGYPRRALRLHAAAQLISERHGGEVPSSVDALLALPGVALHGRGGRELRVRPAAPGPRYQRAQGARADGHGPAWLASSTTAAEIALARSLLPARPEVAARWSVAVMELGALVCTATRPQCAACPVAAGCAWRLAGSPAGNGRRASQPYQGTNRQCRCPLRRSPRRRWSRPPARS